MRRNPKRYYGAGDLHFITCSCYRRQPLLGTARRRDLLLTVLEQVRKRYEFVVVGYVVMPEHIHLLISEPQKKNPSTVMRALKLGFARRVLAQARRRRNPSQARLFDHAPQHIWRVAHIKVESLTRVAFDLGTHQLGMRHFSRFLRSGPRCCRHKARFRFSAGHFSKARSGAPGRWATSN